MPFYFALPRTGTTSNQGRQTTGRTEYVRSAPTTLTFTTKASLNRMQYYVSNNLHGLAMSALAGEKSGNFDKAFKVDASSRLLYPQVDPNSVIPITLPRLSFRFGVLSATQVERLDELEMEERNVKGKGKVWVGSLNAANAKEVMKFGVLPNYAAMGGTISLEGVDIVNRILKLLTLSAKTLSLANGKAGEDYTILEYGSRAPIAVDKYKCSDMTLIEPTNGKREENFTHSGSTFIMALKRLPYIVGNISELSEIVSNGIFCPFEPNFSAADRRAVHLLLSDFSCLATEEEHFEIFDDDITRVWTQEICLTMEGEFLAHMIASLSLAKKIGAQICFLVTGQLYEGSILHGADEFSFKLVGGQTYDSLGRAELVEDVAKYAFHSTTLWKIFDALDFGEDMDPKDIKSMRHLRSVIMGRKGFSISPALQGTLAQQLVFLNFREKPEPVNPSSLGKFFSFIHPTSPMMISDSVYLDRRAFFSNNPTELALAMFGLYAPSPIITGNTLILATSPSTNRKPSNEPPSIQFCLKELSVSAQDWEGFLRGGAIVQPATKIRRGRRFAGADKTQIWGQMTTLAAAGISAKKNERVAIREDKDNEKRDREDRQDPGFEGKRMKMDVVDFSMFDTAMSS